MLVSTHDLLVVLVSLPVAIGAGIAYGIASSRAMVTDLEALAARAAALEAGAGASSPAEQARPSVAGRRSGGTAEVATVAEALEAAEARLAAARERERAMDASRRDLIAWISHDLRTPLASLRALAEALADGVAIDEATRGRYLAGLLAHIDRLTGLVDALLELSQVEAGALAFEREPVSLPELVAEVLEGFEPEAAAGGVRLQTAAGNGGALVLAGRDQLNRVLANLVHNGIRHTRPGGRLLVTIGQRADGGAVTLRVRDGCGGIAEPDLARVFDRLWRGDPARSSRGAGRAPGGGPALPVVPRRVRIGVEQLALIVAGDRIGQGEHLVAGLQAGVRAGRDQVALADHQADPGALVQRQLGDGGVVGRGALGDAVAPQRVGLVPEAHAPAPRLRLDRTQRHPQAVGQRRDQAALDDHRERHHREDDLVQPVRVGDAGLQDEGTEQDRDGALQAGPQHEHPLAAAQADRPQHQADQQWADDQRQQHRQDQPDQPGVAVGQVPKVHRQAEQVECHDLAEAGQRGVEALNLALVGDALVADHDPGDQHRQEPRSPGGGGGPVDRQRAGQ